MSERSPAVGVLLLALLALAACSRHNVPEDRGIVADTAGAPLAPSLEVVDEAGLPVADAQLDFGTLQARTDAQGRYQASGLPGPAVVLVSKPGYLTEPVPLGRAQDGGSLRVRLLSSRGGRRWVYHAGGDVMLARRYLQPDQGAALLPAGSEGPASEALLAPLARVFAVADLRSLNLETVVSRLPPQAAYPRKRFVLNTPPAALAGIASLRPDAVVLANNHQRDFLDAGIAETLQALDGAGLVHLGARADTGPADAPLILPVAGLRVGILAATTVDGDFVNDAYPLDAAPLPPELPADEAWQYEFRRWGFDGEVLQVPLESRRMGSAWRLFRDAEPRMSEQERAAAWTSLYAVYPELQDWVSRRGHGGAALGLIARSVAQLQSLATQTDLVIVNLHAGFQFQEAASESLRAQARALIDAGAGLVIAHHPHVLQGLEWYKGRLIAYSLGNLVFEQNFLSTFASAVLRIVFDGDQLLEARLLPLELAAYQPVFATDEAAAATLHRLWERSLIGAATARDADQAVRAYLLAPPPDTRPAQLRREGHTARVLAEPQAARPLALTVPAHATLVIPGDGLVDAQLGLGGSDASVEVGRGLYGWGHFEDVLADGAAAGGTHFVLGSPDEKVIVGDAYAGRRYLRLRRGPDREELVSARALARVNFPRHRLYTQVDGVPVPADPEPAYSLHLAARLSAPASASVRIDLYHFDDSNPTEDPESTLLAALDLPLAPRPGAGWQLLQLDLPPELLARPGPAINAALVSFRLAPAGGREVTLDIDDYEFVEWRRAAAMPARFGEYRYLRNPGAQDASLRFDLLPATP